MSSQIKDMRAEALRLFQVAIEAADPAKALAAHFSEPLSAPAGGRLILIAVGKAASPMMEQALAMTNGPSEALVVTNYENARDISGATVIAAGHPVPDENGLKGAKAVTALLNTTSEKDHVIAMISGGGSALLPLPAEGISLADKAATNEVLLGAGFDIIQMNLVRQQLSQMKGGGMVRFAAPAKVEAYILSDVVGDDLRAIASGPTVAPIGTKADARELLKDVWKHLPASVQSHLSKDDEPAAATVGENHLICSNRKSLEAMQAAHPSAVILNDRLEGNVAEIGPHLKKILKETEGPATFLFGGETTVTLNGTGKGGRNQDLALRMAMSDVEGDWVFLSGGTDGRDGPTDAAGGLVDSNSQSRMIKAGVDPEALLNNNDAYEALKASEDLVITGGTGTNVADVQILMKL